MSIVVQQFQRKPGPIHFSMERVFATVRQFLPDDIRTETYICPFSSRRIIRRLCNVAGAMFHQRDLNHIVGDVHYLALGLKKHRTILTIHDCVGLKFKRGLGRSFLLWFWYRFPIQRVRAVTAISQFTRDELLRYTNCNPDLVHVIPDPVPNGFAPSPKAFNERYPVLLQVGTSPHNKNILRLAESLKGIQCRLDIIGRLNEEQRDALENNGVLYTEQWGLSDQQVVEKYRECDLVVFVSTYEGFGMPILEANATGRPVVTSNIAPMSEVAGNAGCLVDPFDSESIRAGIVSVLSNRKYREDLVNAGFENILQYSPQVVAQRYADLYRLVAERAKIAKPDQTKS